MDRSSDQSGTDLKKDEESQDEGSEDYQRYPTDEEYQSQNDSLKAGDDASYEGAEVYEQEAIDDPEATRFDELTQEQEQPNQQRISLPLLSKYEKAKVLGLRAEQINNNSPIYVSIQFEQLQKMNSLEIAQLELNQNKIPFIVRRLLPNGQYQNWKLSELEWPQKVDL